MKAYFTASIVGKRHYLDNYSLIIATLKKLGCEVFSDHIMKTTESEIHFETREERLKFHDRLKEWIAGCDFVVVEASFPSISVGYEISLALNLNKPVLILCNGVEPPSLFKSHKNEKLVCEQYTVPTLKGILKDFINYADDKNDTRFTFFITPRIAAFLEEVSRKKRIPKAVFLRHLLEQAMDDTR